MILVPFLSVHLDGVCLQDGQSEMVESIETDGYAEILEELPDSYSVFRDGEFMACGGIYPQSATRAIVWSLIGIKVCGTDMVKLTRIVKKKLDTMPYKRLEAHVKEGFEEGHRWMGLLGFKCETPNGMVNWFNNGEKAYLYARIL